MSNSSAKRVAIIGGGNIASFHVNALRAVGINVNQCASSLNSKRVYEFAKNNNIENIFLDPKKLASAYSEWDGLLITSSVDSTLELLEIAMSSEKPILVEKPVAVSPEKLEKFLPNPPPKVIVAYNRRHYSTVQKAKDFVSKSQWARATMTLPENVSREFESPYQLVYTNSVHGFDILNFIFGDISVEHISTPSDNNPYFGRQAILRSKGGHLINLCMNWGSPANFTLSIDNTSNRLDLSPFEKFQLFNGIEVLEPSIEYPLRQYIPKIVSHGTVFDGEPAHIKPGFLGQSVEFLNLLEGTPPMISANLSDAYKALKLADKIVQM